MNVNPRFRYYTAFLLLLLLALLLRMQTQPADQNERAETTQVGPYAMTGMPSQQ